jgi:outer membrane protein assembly factor BamD (BamD/ComL family)
MKKLMLILPLLAAWTAPVFSQTAEPAKILFDAGVRAEQAGRVDRAKLTFLTLAATYTTDPWAAKAKVEIGAIYLFMDAQARVSAGQTRAAYDAFHTVMTIYPESPLAQLADEAAKSLGIPQRQPK